MSENILEVKGLTSIAIAGVSVVAICGLSFVLSNLFFRKKYI